MSKPPVRAPRCPGCDGPPLDLLGGLVTPYFCANDNCNVVSWDPDDDPAKFKARSKYVDLSFLDPESEQ
jgi:hypothetical protein